MWNEPKLPLLSLWVYIEMCKVQPFSADGHTAFTREDRFFTCNTWKSSVCLLWSEFRSPLNMEHMVNRMYKTVCESLAYQIRY